MQHLTGDLRVHAQSTFYVFGLGTLIVLSHWDIKITLPVIKEYWAFMDLPYQWSRILGLVHNFELLFSGYLG